MRFALEALQANDGDCLLLHYSANGSTTTRVLIDGGSQGIYRSVLKPRLDSLRGHDPLALRMVMVSHIDSDHITGILDLFKALSDQQDAGDDPFCQIETLWFNSFEQVHGAAHPTVSAATAAAIGGVAIAGLDQQTQAVVASIPQGNRLRQLATGLHIGFNEGAGAPLVVSLTTGARAVPLAPGLTFTILAPPQAQLDRLEQDWNAAQSAHPADPAAQTADYLNNTVPNMSSIVVLAEALAPDGTKKRMLLTGDARGDVILDALATAGIGVGGRAHFDLLKVQHHGSNHSTTQDFFERVTADQYVISGNGKHGIPHPEALGFLSAARRGQAYEVVLTNRTGVDGLKTMLDTFLAGEAASEPLHAYRFRGEQDLSITVELSS
jgi:beta-lactamase superfamily II metal-dependent hydrolase